MRIYATCTSSHLKTVKAQGERIRAVWQEQRGIEVQVKRITRSSGHTKHTQHGFVVLESIFEAFLCHYAFKRDTLIITHERMIEADQECYLNCPANLLAMTEPSNPYWRARVSTYKSSVKSLTREALEGGTVIALKHPLDGLQYCEEFVALEHDGGDWFGIEQDGKRSFLSIDLGTIHVHGGKIVDVPSLRSIDTASLEGGFVDNGTIIYRVRDGEAEVIGRPLTQAERSERAMVGIVPFGIVYEDRPFWM